MFIKSFSFVISRLSIGTFNMMSFSLSKSKVKLDKFETSNSLKLSSPQIQVGYSSQDLYNAKVLSPFV
ncbi:MAG: hypothetical protein LBC61_01325 [Candidatus Peribacteria bacterium]|jgi:hypothetical protein|nr:hypothetical protein [Candidatus Peribacteria bacterium]